MSAEYRKYEEEIRNYLSKMEADNIPDNLWATLWESDIPIKEAVVKIRDYLKS